MPGKLFLFMLSCLWFYEAYKMRNKEIYKSDKDKITRRFLIFLGTTFLLASFIY
jgi:hypothetical protein